MNVKLVLLFDVLLCFEVLNKTKVTGEIVLMEKFYNSNRVPFSKIYLKLKGVNEIKTARGVNLKSKLARARVILASSNTTNEIELVQSDNLLFKLRQVYFKNALPVYRHIVRNILERVWTNKLDKRQFESQNGLRVEVSIIDIAHFLTNKYEHAFGYKYTVSINGQDPEFLAIKEPTYGDYMRETAAQSQNSTTIEFCPCNAFEVERVYIKYDNSIDELKEKIDEILIGAWNELNVYRNLSTNRIVTTNKLETGFYDATLDNLTRLEVTWLVDGANPNPIYFKSPRMDDLLAHFENSTISVYEGIPLIGQSLKFSAYNSSHDQLLKQAVLNAWSKANPSIDERIFFLTLEPRPIVRTKRELLSAKLRSMFTQANVNYYVGVNENTFDITELERPTQRMIRSEIKQLVPGVKFDDDEQSGTITDNVNLNDPGRKNIEMTVRVSLDFIFTHLLFASITLSILSTSFFSLE